MGKKRKVEQSQRADMRTVDGDALRSKLKSMGWSNSEECCRVCGVGDDTLSNTYRTNRMNIHKLQKICNKLNLSASDFIMSEHDQISFYDPNDEDLQQRVEYLEMKDREHEKQIDRLNELMGILISTTCKLSNKLVDHE